MACECVYMGCMRVCYGWGMGASGELVWDGAGGQAGYRGSCFCGCTDGMRGLVFCPCLRSEGVGGACIQVRVTHVSGARKGVEGGVCACRGSYGWV